MSLLCPYNECNRTFTRHQSLSQHIRKSHSVVECKLSETYINESDADLFRMKNYLRNWTYLRWALELILLVNWKLIMTINISI